MFWLPRILAKYSPHLLHRTKPRPKSHFVFISFQLLRSKSMIVSLLSLFLWASTKKVVGRLSITRRTKVREPSTVFLKSLNCVITLWRGVTRVACQGAKTCMSFSFKSDPSQFLFLISIIYQWIVYWWVKAVKPARVISDRGQQNARVDKVDCEFCRVRKTLKQSRRDQFISNVFHATFPDWCSFVHWFFSLIRCRTCHELGFRTYGWPRWDEC